MITDLFIRERPLDRSLSYGATAAIDKSFAPETLIRLVDKRLAMST